MGDGGLNPRLRFLRSWDEESGARSADVAVYRDALVSRGRAWLRAETAEFDLSQLNPGLAADAATLARLVDAIAASPMGGATHLRLLLPPTVNSCWLSASTRQAAAVRFGFCAPGPVALPRVGVAGLGIVPLSDLGWQRFKDLFSAVLTPADVGLTSVAELTDVAWALWSGRVVEGSVANGSFAINGPTGPFGIFFTSLLPKKGTSVGFAGVLPRARRTKGLVEALRLALDLLGRTGAYPLWLEVEATNRRSLALAARVAGPPTYLLAVYRLS